MPLIYIHGVNTRKGAKYDKDVAKRNELFQNLVLKPLMNKGDRFKKIAIINPYWGNHGASFRWNQASLPSVSAIEHLGNSDDGTRESDFEITETLKELTGSHQRGSLQLEDLGVDDGIFKQAAEKDLIRFVEALLSPLILSETNLIENAQVLPETEGRLQALLAIASGEIANDPNIKAQVVTANSDEEIMSLLKNEIQARFEQLITPEDVMLPDSQLESLGPDWLEDVKDRVGELIERAKDAPSRAATLPVLELFRETLHHKLSRFLGDVFIYLNERGDKTKPGLIISTVLEAITTAPRNHPDEPLIIITHSMGGNILYDILTYYVPELKVDAWVSVGGQVAQFEEMKLFKASDKSIGEPERVMDLEPRVGYWLNIYDPADSFSFKTEPVFRGVKDLAYLTGANVLKSHSEYFGRVSFYWKMQECLEKVL